MNLRIYFSIFILAFLASCSVIKTPVDGNQRFEDELDTLSLYDQKRQREIPVAIYKPKTKKRNDKQKVVIFSHGYGHNKNGVYLSYSYLTAYLASQGYFVISIQHELKTDGLLPSTGNIQELRRPFWERGAENIMFVVKTLKKKYPNLDFKKITLIGHSNGGDMSALFAQKYPEMVSKIITLDNRRMVLPRTEKPQVYSLRSSDQPADEGVLPTPEEELALGMKIVKLPNTTHNNMSNKANNKQREEIRKYVMEFMKEPA